MEQNPNANIILLTDLRFDSINLTYNPIKIVFFCYFKIIHKYRKFIFLLLSTFINILTSFFIIYFFFLNINRILLYRSGNISPFQSPYGLVKLDSVKLLFTLRFCYENIVCDFTILFDIIIDNN